MEHQEIREVLAGIQSNYERVLEHVELSEEGYGALEEGRIYAIQYSIAEYLAKLEAAGAPCPTMVEICGWLGYANSAVLELANKLDSVDGEEAEAVARVLEQTMRIADSEGEAAAREYVEAVAADVEREQVNRLLREAAEDERVEPGFLAEEIEPVDANINGDKVKPIDADDLIAYVQKHFPGADITRKYGSMGAFGIDGGSLTIKINYLPH